MKTCTKCGEEKSLTKENFRPYKSGTLRSVCRACERAYTLHYCKTNKTHKRPHVRAYQKKYGETHKDEIRSTIYKRRLGITWEEVKAMAEKQNNGCAICKNPIDWENRRSFNVDHCHGSGKIRGILCVRCNLGIGHFNDDTALLGKAINYLTI